MIYRPAIASVLPLLFTGFGAWAGVTTGVITGEVTDSSTGDPIFGAVIGDYTDAIPNLGSFAGDGVYFILNVPEGFRDNIKVSAPGYFDKSGQVTVDQGAPGVLDIQLDPDISLNTAEISLLIDNPTNPNSPEMYLLPPIVYAFQDFTLVGTASARAGRKYRISRIPDGNTTFLAFSPYFNVGSTNVSLSDNRTVQVTIQVDAPATRGPISGSIGGVVSDLKTPIEAHVDATFPFEGVPITVTTDSAPGTGAYQIDLLPPNPVITGVEAFAISTTDRTPAPVATPVVMGGMVATQDLMVVPFDPVKANFIPIVQTPTAIDMDEDDTRVLMINEFGVIDSDHSFSAFHTLVIHPGSNYTRSDIQPGSTQINLAADWNGSIIVPVSISDPLNTSAPLLLTVTVNPLPDAIVHVNFDTGLPAGGGGTGGAANPFQAVGEALSAVTAAGTILIKGIAPSTEPPFTINQGVTLQNNNTMGEVVRIAPSGARQTATASPAKSGFVTRSDRPSRNHRSGK